MCHAPSLLNASLDEVLQKLKMGFGRMKQIYKVGFGENGVLIGLLYEVPLVLFVESKENLKRF